MARPRAGDWLAGEIAGWKEAGVDAVVSLLEREEEGELGLHEEAELCRDAHMSFISFPIRDYDVPASARETGDLAQDIVAKLAAAQRVAIHCRAGIGRSSVIAACALICLGVGWEEAVARIAAARGMKVPDTEAQRDWISRFRAPSA